MVSPKLRDNTRNWLTSSLALPLCSSWAQAGAMKSSGTRHTRHELSAPEKSIRASARWSWIAHQSVRCACVPHACASSTDASFRLLQAQAPDLGRTRGGYTRRSLGRMGQAVHSALLPSSPHGADPSTREYTAWDHKSGVQARPPITSDSGSREGWRTTTCAAAQAASRPGMPLALSRPCLPLAPRHARSVSSVSHDLDPLAWFSRRNSAQQLV